MLIIAAIAIVFWETSDSTIVMMIIADIATVFRRINGNTIVLSRGAPWLQRGNDGEVLEVGLEEEKPRVELELDEGVIGSFTGDAWASACKGTPSPTQKCQCLLRLSATSRRLQRGRWSHRQRGEYLRLRWQGIRKRIWNWPLNFFFSFQYWWWWRGVGLMFYSWILQSPSTPI